MCAQVCNFETSSAMLSRSCNFFEITCASIRAGGHPIFLHSLNLEVELSRTSGKEKLESDAKEKKDILTQLQF